MSTQRLVQHGDGLCLGQQPPSGGGLTSASANACMVPFFQSSHRSVNVCQRIYGSAARGRSCRSELKGFSCPFDLGCQFDVQVGCSCVAPAGRRLCVHLVKDLAAGRATV